VGAGAVIATLLVGPGKRTFECSPQDPAGVGDGSWLPLPEIMAAPIKAPTAAAPAAIPAAAPGLMPPPPPDLGGGPLPPDPAPGRVGVLPHHWPAAVWGSPMRDKIKTSANAETAGFFITSSRRFRLNAIR
jgi:hypothetical protein